MRSILLLPPGALVLGAQAAAPDRRPSRPTGDVTVERKVLEVASPAEPPSERLMKVYCAEGGAQMRIEMGDERYDVVPDRDAQRTIMVLLDRHGYVETPYDPKRQTGFTIPPNLPLMCGRDDIVAGCSCTLWHAKPGAGDATLCIINDNVLLRLENDNDDHHGDLVATAVNYGPQPASVFDPPPGFHMLDIAPMRAPAPAATRKC